MNRLRLTPSSVSCERCPDAAGPELPAVGGAHGTAMASPPGAVAAAAFLLLAYILNFLDRQILGILAQPIKADLNSTDAQFGAIGGLAFALLYSVLAVPLALLADRTRRSWVIAGALAVWSGFTALCGTAASYGQLFLSAWRRGRRGRRRRALLCADRRLFRAGAPRPRPGHLLAGRAAWARRRNACRRLHRLVDRLARRLHGDGHCGLLLAPVMLLFVRDAAARASRPRKREPLIARLPDHRAQADLLADGLCRLLQFPVRLRPGFVDALDPDSQLRPGPCSTRAISSPSCCYRRHHRRLRRRLACRPARHADRGWYAQLPAIAWLITAPTFLPA